MRFSRRSIVDRLFDPAADYAPVYGSGDLSSHQSAAYGIAGNVGNDIDTHRGGCRNARRLAILHGSWLDKQLLYTGRIALALPSVVCGCDCC